MKTAIHFGAGNIGRGFIGGLLSLSGYKVVFADISEPIINKLKEDQQYTIQIVDVKTEELVIKNVTGVMSNDPKLIDVAEEADVVTAAVGPVALPKIASTVAAFIKRRKEKGITRALNVIACENLFGASEVLRDAAIKFLAEDEVAYLNQNVSFPNSVVDRIVPPGQTDSGNILAVRVEPFYEWIVDKYAFKADIPQIEGMILAENLQAYVERKLLTLNTAHAITAYLGKQAGYETIRQSISDENIKKIVLAAMGESGAILVKKHGFDKDAHAAYIQKILKRFDNPYLDDSVDRVGREPLRKLSINDRFIKPILMAEEFAVEPKNLIVGAAAAFRFKCESDQQSVELQKMIEELGIRETIIKVTGLDSTSQFIDKIAEAYNLASK